MVKSISMMQKKRGFTLIELIVILAVLAIIMAIALPRFGGVKDEAKYDADMATLASIAKLAEFEYVRQDLENLKEVN
jgi:type IV pilus assembly protein PilA